MVTNNKVLTVSYGTFSCTLEGFDDSFDTMKAIAEYFRDLAADDRYFGAEPPTPDAEMLARIAEREVARRVEARTEHGAIVLTSTDPAAAEAQPQEEPQPIEEIAESGQDAIAEVDEPEAEPEIVDVTDSVLQAVAIDTEAEEETAEIDAPTAEEIDDDIVEIEPVVAEIKEAPEADDAPEEAEIVALDESSEAADAEPIEDADVVELAADLEPSEDEDDSDDAMIADILEASAEEEEVQAEFVAELVEDEPVPQPDPNADSIAAKLQRIRAVVSKSRNEPEEDDFSEDEHAEPLIAETAEDPEPVLTLDDDMAAAAAAMDAEVVEEVAEDSDDQPLRARVIRMKTADIDAAVDEGLLETEEIEEDEDEQSSSSLSAEEEAELLAELAQVEAELNGEIDDDEPVEAIGADVEGIPQRSSRGRHLTDAAEQSDADMARLLQEADTQLEEPDGSRRRQAIAHLRAAVAATKAEQKASKDGDKPRDGTVAYRDDLASVMRPHSKGAEKKSSQPPLKLVAEQRVDSPEEANAKETPEETRRTTVRPRRVSAADRNEHHEGAPVGQDVENFTEFAESVGAHDLPDVLEAAAAYLTFVEKRDVFSRPMIVRMAQGMSGSDFSREDSLRGFGQLLRENKITKVSGGRFTASDEISYRPEDRAVG